ncbi:MAG: hypothetical protein ICV78_26440 [Tolypothrix sp. Co-bin9]|jgi:hypothetical protein|nr:hypothetical protein [Tolypothrix sp. Co-bin9]
MNSICQLAQLILDFYREEPQQLRQLRPLRNCKVFRRWGVLYIRCDNQETAAALMNAGLAIAEPVARLRLAKKITLLTNNTSVAVFPVDYSKINA